VALLCTTAGIWSHEIVPCAFFYRPSKKQLHVCGVFRKKVTVVCKWQKSRRLQFEQHADIKFCQKLGNSASETFHMIRQEYSEEAMGCNAVLLAQTFCIGEREFKR
jgi:hypothetical protein